MSPCLRQQVVVVRRWFQRVDLHSCFCFFLSLCWTEAKCRRRWKLHLPSAFSHHPLHFASWYGSNRGDRKRWWTQQPEVGKKEKLIIIKKMCHSKFGFLEILKSHNPCCSAHFLSYWNALMLSLIFASLSVNLTCCDVAMSLSLQLHYMVCVAQFSVGVCVCAEERRVKQGQLPLIFRTSGKHKSHQSDRG